MKLTKLAGDCDDGPCAAIHDIDATDDVLFQGYEVTDPAVLAQLDIPPGEIVGRLPARFVLEAAAKLRGRA
ncbi:MAG: hypothetical protein ACRDZ4_23810 [Egibacteraceae bacterium]